MKIFILVIAILTGMKASASESVGWVASDPNNIYIMDNIGLAQIQSDDKGKGFLFFPLDSIAVGYSCPTENDIEQVYVKLNGVMEIWGTKCVDAKDFTGYRKGRVASRQMYAVLDPENIVESLKKDKPVKIEIRGKTYTISTKGFNEAYELLK
jgi:hypothetical protein